jgi:hypothetical protein
VVNCALVPQIEWSMDGTDFGFLVRRPGVYTTCVTTMVIEANADASIRFESFGDLQPVTEGGSLPISASYAVASPDATAPPAVYLSPADFNEQSMVAPANTPYRLALWSKIVIENATAGCDYEDEATIRLELINHQVWVDSTR